MCEDETTVMKLIKAVENQPVIYNVFLEGHMNKHVLDRAWNEVSKETNLIVAACKERWRNIRNCWCRHIRNTSEINPKGKKKKSYYLAEYLTFLKPFSTSKGKPVNSDISNEEESSLEESYNEQSIDFIETIDHIKEERSTSSLSERINDPISSIENQPSSSNLDVPQIKRPASDNVCTSYFETKKQRKSEPDAQEDTDLLFLRSILPEMSMLTPPQKNSFKLFILQKLQEFLYSSDTGHI